MTRALQCNCAAQGIHVSASLVQDGAAKGTSMAQGVQDGPRDAHASHGVQAEGVIPTKLHTAEHTCALWLCLVGGPAAAAGQGDTPAADAGQAAHSCTPGATRLWAAEDPWSPGAAQDMDHAQRQEGAGLSRSQLCAVLVCAASLSKPPASCTLLMPQGSDHVRILASLLLV